MANDGGQAFPSGSVHGSTHVMRDGMTLRDYFAGQALGGFCATLSGSNLDVSWFEQHGAKAAYRVADAMIAERNK